MKSEQLTKYELLIEKRLKTLYGKAYEDIIKLPQVQKIIRDGGLFEIKGVQLEKLVDKIIINLNKQIENIATETMQKAWMNGLTSSTLLMQNAFGNYKDGKLIVDEQIKQATEDRRDATKEAYKLATQKKGGLNLSERVWKLNEAAKIEIETIIQNGIKEGKGADLIQQSVKKYLNNQNTLFRRVRDKETGNLKLSKAAKNYHPGQGVYRSAYKNAMRLIRNEVNIAYREAEWMSYQNNNLIKGFQIRLSNNHTTLINGEPTPFRDICDELQGVYPKTFKWNGWHVQCYSNDTEVLTNNGWKLFKEIQKDDLIFSLNPETKQPEYVKIINSYSYQHRGDMVLFKNKTLDLLVTPDHKINYINKTSGEFSSKLAKEYKHTNGALYRSSEYIGNHIEYINIGNHKIDFNLYCEFMGYWLADGYTVSTRENTFGISQTKTHDLETYTKITELSKKLPFHYNCEKEKIMYHNKEMYKHLLQFGKALNKYIPIKIKESSVNQIQIFLNAFLCCDGCIIKPKSFIGNKGHAFNAKNETKIYFTSSKQLAADLGELLVKIGKRPSYSIVVKKGTEHTFKNGTYKTNSDCWRIAECNGKTASVFNKSYIEYDSAVYDVELEKNHILYVRRNGKCVWSSNCRCIMIPILLTPSEFAKYAKARKEGKEYDNKIKELPKNFDNYIKENKERFDNLKNKPSWYETNIK